MDSRICRQSLSTRYDDCNVEHIRTWLYDCRHRTSPNTRIWTPPSRVDNQYYTLCNHRRALPCCDSNCQTRQLSCWVQYKTLFVSASLDTMCYNCSSLAFAKRIASSLFDDHCCCCSCCYCCCCNDRCWLFDLSEWPSQRRILCKRIWLCNHRQVEVVNRKECPLSIHALAFVRRPN